MNSENHSDIEWSVALASNHTETPLSESISQMLLQAAQKRKRCTIRMCQCILLLMIRPVPFRAPANLPPMSICDFEKAGHHCSGFLDAAPSVKVYAVHEGHLCQDLVKQSPGEPLVEPVGLAKALEDVITRVALDEDGQFAHIDAFGEPQRRVHDPAARRLIPARAEAQLERRERPTLTSVKARKEGFLRLEKAPGFRGEYAKRVCAVEHMRGLVVDGPAGSKDAQLLVDALVVTRVEVDNRGSSLKVGCVYFDAQLGREVQEPERVPRAPLDPGRHLRQGSGRVRECQPIYRDPGYFIFRASFGLGSMV